MRRNWKCICCLLISFVPLGCGLVPAQDAQEAAAGFERIASKPAEHWHCQTLASRGDVLAIMIGSSITLYRKKEGVFFYGTVNKRGMTQKQTMKWFKDPEACAKWDLANWTVSDPRFYVFNHPYFIELFDNAESDPDGFFAKMQHGPPYFAYRDQRDGQPTVSFNGRAVPAPGFYSIANQLQTIKASDLIRDIDVVRRMLSPSGVAAANVQRVAEVNTARQQRSAIAAAAEQAFMAASSRTKSVGTTVCSADNRIAYVEQVAGPRIKLAVRGRLLARENQFGDLGPHDLDYSAAQVGGREDLPVEDPHFLFNSLPGTLHLSTESTMVWDEGRYWGECAYR